ncbi:MULTISPECIES: PP2C family protein-serine/threonine phosphatase [unclassified Streptomyces]|uniref:PP2C family protein-serine/threonine phosphatase n=1 Tax=Streptomyces sp. NPDC005955 TaxID=3364738 RepID=UPI00368CEA3E
MGHGGEPTGGAGSPDRTPDPVPDRAPDAAPETAPDPVPGAGRHRRTARRGRWFVRVLPVLLIVIGLFYDELTPLHLTASPLFAAAPLAAAPFYGRRGTVAVGLMACAASVGERSADGGLARADAITDLATIVTVSVLAVVINGLARRSNARLASAREIAEAAQRAVLPEPADRIGGLDVAARYEAAQADASIGGDLYAVQDTPHGVRLVVGDVRGKGITAVSAVAVLIGAFREAAEQETTLEAVARRLERALAREGTRRRGVDDFEGFTTAVLAELPHGQDVVRVLNRGHPPPLLLAPDGALTVLDPGRPALPLGMADLGVWPDRCDEAPFPSGTTLLGYTDGLSEARDAHGAFYDPVARLRGRTFPGPNALLAVVINDVVRHTGGGSEDDLALLAVRRP